MDWENNNRTKKVGRKFGYDVDRMYLDLTHVNVRFKDKRSDPATQGNMPKRPPSHPLEVMREKLRSEQNRLRAASTVKTFPLPQHAVDAMIEGIYERAAFKKNSHERKMAKSALPRLLHSFGQLDTEQQKYAIANWGTLLRRAIRTGDEFVLPKALGFIADSSALLAKFKLQHGQRRKLVAERARLAARTDEEIRADQEGEAAERRRMRANRRMQRRAELLRVAKKR